MHSDENGFKFLWPEAAAFNAYASITFGAGIIISGSLFSKLFLRTRRFHPVIDKLLGAIILLTLGMLAASAFLDNQPIKKMLVLLAFAAIATFVLAGLVAARALQAGPPLRPRLDRRGGFKRADGRAALAWHRHSRFGAVRFHAHRHGDRCGADGAGDLGQLQPAAACPVTGSAAAGARDREGCAKPRPYRGDADLSRTAGGAPASSRDRARA